MYILSKDVIILLKSVVILGWLSLFWWFSLAWEWNLPWIDIVTREERWAYDSWLEDDHQWYNWRTQNRELYNTWIEGWAVSGTSAFVTELNKRQRATVANQRLMQNHPSEVDVKSYTLDDRWFTLDQVVLWENNKTFRWPRTYKDTKNKILIHHTAGAFVEDLEEGKEQMQSIAKNHTFSNGWWDIWYNFLIDSAWNIYEGRSWWESVIWAHMSWNNTSSIGIALMWDYDKKRPTDEMKIALLKLTTVLSKKYDIEPNWRSPYVVPSADNPFVFIENHASISGHWDAWATDCPGDFVHSYLPTLRSQTEILLQYYKDINEISFDEIEFMTQDVVQYSADDTIDILLPYQIGENIDCKIGQSHSSITACLQTPWWVKVSIKRTTYASSWATSLILLWSKGIVVVPLVLLWQQDLDQLLVFRQQRYTQTFWQVWTALKTKKISAYVPAESIKQHIATPVKVLLYELSTSFAQRDIVCMQWCDVELDTLLLSNAKELSIIHFPTYLEVYVDGAKFIVDDVYINNNWLLRFVNYGRASSTWIPRNIFRWDISVQNERMRDVQKWWKDTRTVVNHVSFDDYLKGIAETSDQDHLEKIKAIYLAVKNYTAHYLSWENIHPFVTTDWSYTMVDDSRVMQKYVGYGIEQTITKRYEAIRQLKNTWISYEDNIVIIPYFHCSAWFTRSWFHYFGRTDTPWLTSVLDVASCPNTSKFKGHGVGMSWVWANRLAEAWVKYDEILKWYYKGIEVRIY